MIDLKEAIMINNLSKIFFQIGKLQKKYNKKKNM